MIEDPNPLASQWLPRHSCSLYVLSKHFLCGLTICD
jgi:hypothetical protein